MSACVLVLSSPKPDLYTDDRAFRFGWFTRTGPTVLVSLVFQYSVLSGCTLQVRNLWGARNGEKTVQ